MHRALLATCFALVLTTTGCFISRTKEREVPSTASRTSRTCGNQVCAPSEDCVASASGSFHCE